MRVLKGDDDLRALVEEFIHRPNLSASTRDFYGKLRYLLLPYAKQRGIRSPEELTPDVIDDLAAELERQLTAKGKPLAAPSRAAYMRAVRQFLGWLQKRKGIAGVDASQVSMPHLRKRHRDVLTRLEIRQLEQAARIPRDALLIALLGETGARLGEVGLLRLEHLIRAERQGFVDIPEEGKTGQRRVGVSDQLFKRLQEYARGGAGRPQTRSPYLFMSSRKRPGAAEYEPLGKTGIYKAVKNALDRSGLQKRVYPHLFRHSAATYYLVEAAHPLNPLQVSRMLGMSLSVIQANYLHETDGQLALAQMRALGEWVG